MFSSLRFIKISPYSIIIFLHLMLSGSICVFGYDNYQILKNFIILPQELIVSLRNGKDVILVDVRSKKDYKKSRIPGSINIPLYAFKTKLFLKKKNVIIISNGLKYAHIQQECEKLQKIGFTRLKILYGGISGWISAGGPLEGENHSFDEFRQVSYFDLYEERLMNDWILVNISNSVCPKSLKSLLPYWQIIEMQYTNDYGLLEKKLTKFLSKYTQSTSELHRILFVLPKSMSMQHLKKIVSKIGLQNYFFLRGNLQGYVQFLQTQKRIQQARRRLEKKKIQSRPNKRCLCEF